MIGDNGRMLALALEEINEFLVRVPNQRVLCMALFASPRHWPGGRRLGRGMR